MRDAKLIFDDCVAVADDRLSTNVLNTGAVEEFGRGSQLFIEIWLKTAFTSTANTLEISLISDDTTPTDADKVMVVLPALPTSAMQTPGLLAKVPIPSKGMKSLTALYYDVSATLADGEITAHLTLI